MKTWKCTTCGLIFKETLLHERAKVLFSNRYDLDGIIRLSADLLSDGEIPCGDIECTGKIYAARIN